MSLKRNPLELAELVALVMEHIAESRDISQLVRCAQVNKLWAKEATLFRWESTSSTQLFKHVSPARRPYYSRKVREITVSGSADLQLLDDSGSDANLLWPRLKVLIARERAGSGDDQLLQFLSPHLQELDLYDGWASDNILAQVPALCPRLSRVVLDKSDDFTADGVLSLLRASESISVITLYGNYDMHHAISPQLLCHLASRKGLKRLRLCGAAILQWYLPDGAWESTSPFPDLTCAWLYTEPLVIAHLLPYLRELDCLEVKFCSPAIHPLFPDAQCSKLTNLRIKFCPVSVMDGQDLVDLADRCRGLRHIRLVCDDDLIIINNLTDTVMGRIASRLQHLSRFEILMQEGKNTAISIESLQSFGTHCRDLTSFDINLDFALQDISPEGLCLFPELEELGVREIDHYIAEIPGAIVPVLQYHFPRLSQIEAGDGDITFRPPSYTVILQAVAI